MHALMIMQSSTSTTLSSIREQWQRLPLWQSSLLCALVQLEEAGAGRHWNPHDDAFRHTCTTPSAPNEPDPHVTVITPMNAVHAQWQRKTKWCSISTKHAQSIGKHQHLQIHEAIEHMK